jgi:hypothetical protein
VTINVKLKVFFPFRRGGFYRGRGGRGTSERGDGKELDDDHEEGEQVCQCYKNLNLWQKARAFDPGKIIQPGVKKCG